MTHAPSVVPGALESSEPAGPLTALRAWILKRLDALLSDRLRASPAELSHARVLAGTTCALVLFTLVYLVSMQLSPRPWFWSAPGLGVELALLGTLVLLRKATSTTAAALLLCATIAGGDLATSFLYMDPYMNTHVANALAPAFSVYLMGPRKGLLITAFSILLMVLTVTLLHGVFAVSAPPTHEYLWQMNLAAILSVLALWLLGTLHSTARDAAQGALEKTLKTLNDSERKLSSLFENTDDMVCSLDTEGRLLIANTSLRRTYAQRYGKELVLGERLFSEVDPEHQEVWAQQFRKALEGQHSKFELTYALDDSRIVLEASIGPILGEGDQPVGMTLFARDITARKEAEARLGEMHRTLVDVSRQAGMAEVATGVLHNVGNTLNSVNISANLITDGLRRLRVPALGRAVELLHAHSADLGSFLTTDSRGQKLPGYLQALTEQLGQEQEALLKETTALNESVEHIKSIVSMQQKHARTVGAVESLPVPQLIDEALRLHAVSFERLGIVIERDYAEVPPILADRHKLLQILMNLLSNARDALVESGRQDKRLSLRVRPSADGQHLLIELADNGVGIAPEHLPRLFSQGFTTKKTGHGFGLHISALSALELKGRLGCTSPGLGQGATFTLELPLPREHADE